MLSAAQFDQGLQVVAALLILLAVFTALRHSPKMAVTAWLVVICLVPIWIGVSALVYLPAFTVVSLLGAISLLPAAARVRWSVVDLLFVVVLVVVIAEFAFSITTRSATFDLVTTWAGAFLFGRLVTSVVDERWIYGAAAVVFSVVGLLAVAEFVTSTNVFISFLGNDTAAYSQWSGQQPRGDVLRSEGAFGHSIAMGTSLGVAMALTLGSRFRPGVKTVMLALMAAGAVVSFSRTGMLTAVLAVLLSCLFLRQPLTRGYRALLLGALGVAAVILFQFVSDVFATSTELFQLIGDVEPFGLASNFSVASTSVVSIGEFGSIDNALLLFGLIFGWVPAVLLLPLLLVAVVQVLRRHATPATIAVVAQIPALVTVALITQYAAVFWFSVGLAVSTQVVSNAARSHRRRPLPLPRHADRDRVLSADAQV